MISLITPIRNFFEELKKKNTEHYIDIFTRLGMFDENKIKSECSTPFLNTDTQEKNIWNWNAFFFGPLWLAKRGFDLDPLIFISILHLFLGLVTFSSLRSGDFSSASACATILFAFMIFFGYFGNRIYAFFVKHAVSFGLPLLDKYRDATFMGYHKYQNDWVHARIFKPYKRQPQKTEINEENVREYLHKEEELSSDVLYMLVAWILGLYFYDAVLSIAVSRILSFFGILIVFNVINAICFLLVWLDKRKVSKELKKNLPDAA